ncbi:hypothetical protein Tco_0803497 [Tanacetum coccineum]|uniref:Uncharacterized protein n=1 Tax=Tanacetum coccineum TaxID=301880 RepID=A0ABQ5A1Q3_9ASTR
MRKWVRTDTKKWRQRLVVEDELPREQNIWHKWHQGVLILTSEPSAQSLEPSARSLETSAWSLEPSALFTTQQNDINLHA